MNLIKRIVRNFALRNVWGRPWYVLVVVLIGSLIGWYFSMGQEDLFERIFYTSAFSATGGASIGLLFHKILLRFL